MRKRRAWYGTYDFRSESDVVSFDSMRHRFSMMMLNKYTDILCPSCSPNCFRESCTHPCKVLPFGSPYLAECFSFDERASERIAACAIPRCCVPSYSIEAVERTTPRRRRSAPDHPSRTRRLAKKRGFPFYTPAQRVCRLRSMRMQLEVCRSRSELGETTCVSPR